MKIKIIKEQSGAKEVKLAQSISVSELAKKMDIVLPNYIVRVNNKIVPEDEKVADGDVIHFFRVISGG